MRKCRDFPDAAGGPIAFQGKGHREATVNKRDDAESPQKEKIKSERLGFGSFELSAHSSYSQTKIRTQFIRVADRLEPGLANSLYQEAFFHFVRVVWSQFPQTIPHPVVGLLEDQGFLIELDRILTDSSASPYNDKSKSIHPAFIELFVPVYKQNPELLINNPRGYSRGSCFDRSGSLQATSRAVSATDPR